MNSWNDAIRADQAVPAEPLPDETKVRTFEQHVRHMYLDPGLELSLLVLAQINELGGIEIQSVQVLESVKLAGPKPEGTIP